MAKRFRIKLGSNENVITGEVVIVAQEKLIKEASRAQELNSDDIDNLRKQVASIRENEKTILSLLLENYASTIDKSLSATVEILDIMEEIKDAEDQVVFTQSELDKLEKSYSSLQKIPVQWFLYKDLLRQLKKPEEIGKDE